MGALGVKFSGSAQSELLHRYFDLLCEWFTQLRVASVRANAHFHRIIVGHNRDGKSRFTANSADPINGLASDDPLRIAPVSDHVRDAELVHVASEEPCDHPHEPIGCQVTKEILRKNPKCHVVWVAVSGDGHACFFNGLIQGWSGPNCAESRTK